MGGGLGCLQTHFSFHTVEIVLWLSWGCDNNLNLTCIELELWLVYDNFLLFAGVRKVPHLLHVDLHGE